MKLLKKLKGPAKECWNHPRAQLGRVVFMVELMAILLIAIPIYLLS